MKYPFKEYVQQQDSALFDVIERFPLATFFCKSEDQAHICHIPVSICKGAKTLFGHATGTNPIKHFVGTTVDIVFRGPDTYLSPNQVEGLSLPTWDYVTVQGQGKLISIEDYGKQLEVMGHILQAFEDKRNPWQLTAVPEKRLKSMCKSLLFFEIQLEALSGNFKLSQNKTAETRADIADLLSNTNPEMRSYYE